MKIKNRLIKKIKSTIRLVSTDCITHPVLRAIVIAEQRHVVEVGLPDHVVAGTAIGLQLDGLLEQRAQSARRQHHRRRQVQLQPVHQADARLRALAGPVRVESMTMIRFYNEFEKYSIFTGNCI